MKIYISTIFIIVAMVIIAFPQEISDYPNLFETGEVDKKNLKYTVCKTKPDYSIDVKLKMIDVTALDARGEHVTELEKEDFELYIDGKKQIILHCDRINHINKIFASDAAQRGSKRLRESDALQKIKDDVEGSRYFAFLVANLPRYHSKKNEIVASISEFINTRLGKNDRIALYNIGRSSLMEFLPFTDNREKIQVGLKQYLQSGEYKKNTFVSNSDFRIDKSLRRVLFSQDSMGKQHTVLYSGAGRGEQRQIFQNVNQMMSILAESMRHIKGRKNIVLISAGMPQGSGPRSTTHYLSRSLFESFNSYNMSVYSFDVSRARADVSPDQEYSTSGFIRNLSAQTGGFFFQHAASGKGKISKVLDDFHYLTAAHYEISYRPETKDSSSKYQKVELKVLKSDVKLFHRAGVATPKKYTEMKDEEKEGYVLLSSRKDIDFHEIPFCTNVSYFPRGNGLTRALFSVEIPLAEIIHNNGSSTECNLLVSCQIYNSSGVFIKELSKKISFKITDREKANQGVKIRHIDFFSLLPGIYNVKFFICDLENGKMASNEHKILLPDYYVSEFALGSIINAEPNTRTIVIDDYWSSLEEDDGTRADNPLSLGSKFLIHTYPSEGNPTSMSNMFITIKGYTIKEIEKNSDGLVSWSISAEDKKQPESREILAKLQKIFPHPNGTYGLLYDLKMPGLAPGEYRLTAIMKDKTGKNILRMLPVKIVSPYKK